MSTCNRVIKRFIILIILLMGCRLGDAATGEPQDKIRQIVNQTIDLLAHDRLNTTPWNKEQPSVTNCFDFIEMAQRAMGPYWYSLTTEQQKEFSTLFSALLEHYYISKIEGANVSQNNVDFKERIEQDRYVTVTTEITKPNGQPLEIVYRLLRYNEDWRVYDIIIAGISLISQYQKQFNTLIHQGSYESLARQMKINLENGQGLK